MQRTLERKTFERDSLMQIKVKLETDSNFVERVAREKLGLAKKDETVYKFIEKREE